MVEAKRFNRGDVIAGMVLFPLWIIVLLSIVISEWSNPCDKPLHLFVSVRVGNYLLVIVYQIVGTWRLPAVRHVLLLTWTTTAVYLQLYVLGSLLVAILQLKQFML